MTRFIVCPEQKMSPVKYSCIQMSVVSLYSNETKLQLHIYTSLEDVLFMFIFYCDILVLET